jgi:hypothetical protein
MDIAQSAMKRHNVTEVFVTSDGVVFLQETFAKSHATKNKLKVETISKQEVEKKPVEKKKTTTKKPQNPTQNGTK